MFNNLEGIKSRAIITYVVSDDSISNLNNGDSLEEQYNNAYEEFEKQCEKFIEKVDIRFKAMNTHERECYIEQFINNLYSSIKEMGVISAQVGMKIGFTFALETGVLGYKEKRGN